MDKKVLTVSDAFRSLDSVSDEILSVDPIDESFLIYGNNDHIDIIESDKSVFDEELYFDADLVNSKPVDESLKEELGKNRLVWDDCTATMNRRPTTQEDIDNDIHVEEFSTKEELLSELLELAGYDEEDFEDYLSEFHHEDISELSFEEKLNYALGFFDDPGDGTPNIFYVMVDGNEFDHWAVGPYEEIKDLDLANCSEEEIKSTMKENGEYDESDSYLWDDEEESEDEEGEPITDSLKEGTSSIYLDMLDDYHKALTRAEKSGHITYTVETEDDEEEFDTWKSAVKYAQKHNINKIHVSSFGFEGPDGYDNGDYEEYEERDLDLNKEPYSESLTESEKSLKDLIKDSYDACCGKELEHENPSVDDIWQDLENNYIHHPAVAELFKLDTPEGGIKLYKIIEDNLTELGVPFYTYDKEDNKTKMNEALNESEEESGEDKELSLTVDVTNDKEIEKGIEFMDNDKEEEPVETIVDVNANIESEVKDSHAGECVLECSKCHGLRYLDLNEEELIQDPTNPKLYNVDDECPTCHSNSGWYLAGQIAQEAETDVEETEVEEETFEPAEDYAGPEVPDDEESETVEEQLNEDILDNINEIDESSFNDNISNYLKEKYINFKSFETKSVSYDDNKLILEGIITYVGDSTKEISFELTPNKLEEGISLKGNTKSLDKEDGEFNFICESLENKLINKKLEK